MNISDSRQYGMIFIVINTSCIALNGMMTNELERMWKEELVDWWR